MSAQSKIEWTEATWNPVTGCTKVSQGCKNCYAERLFPRVYGKDSILPVSNSADGQSMVATGAWRQRKFTDVHCHPERLDQPLRWKRPRRIFVSSMSDLFHEAVPDAFIGHVFFAMAYAPQHTFQVLTKRPGRMLEWLTRDGLAAVRYGEHDELTEQEQKAPWPLPNVWLGVSCEDQATAHERVPLLLETPAAVRFVSAEPLLGPIHLNDPLRRIRRPSYFYTYQNYRDGDPRDIHWVIAGGESGPNARPSHPDWFRSLRDQCQAAGVPFFFKQWGEYALHYDRDRDDPDWQRCDVAKLQTPNGRWLNLAGGHGFHGERVVRMNRIGKRAAGRELDGRTWDEYPAEDT